MYGAISSVIVVMLWFYASGFAILIGAEMNAVLDKALPYGSAARPSKQGARKKIGPAAERARADAHARLGSEATSSE